MRLLPSDVRTRARLAQVERQDPRRPSPAGAGTTAGPGRTTAPARSRRVASACSSCAGSRMVWASVRAQAAHLLARRPRRGCGPSSRSRPGVTTSSTSTASRTPEQAAPPGRRRGRHTEPRYGVTSRSTGPLADERRSRRSRPPGPAGTGPGTGCAVTSAPQRHRERARASRPASASPCWTTCAGGRVEQQVPQRRACPGP